MCLTTLKSWATNRYVRPKSFLKLEQQVQDLRLDRHVEGGNCFIRNDQTRIQRERARDPDPLTLAPGESVGVAPHVFRPKTHKAKQFDNPVDPFLLVSHAVDQQRLADDVEQGHPRIQRRKRVLKDHLHLTPK